MSVTQSVTKPGLFVLKRYALTDLGKALVWCTTLRGRVDTLYIVHDSRNTYLCVCKIAAVGNLAVPDCESYFEMFVDYGSQPERALQICFGPHVLPLPEEQ